MDIRIILLLIFGLVLGSLAAPQKQNSVKEKTDSAKAKILKQINKVNEDGSYTFGYEADDGSFKVETRSKDGVVKGKYGFLDPNGKLKTVEYSAGEKAVKSNRIIDVDEEREAKDQSTASATRDTKTLNGSDSEGDDGRYNENNDEDFNSFGSQKSSEPIDRQDDAQNQYIRQVGQGRDPDEPSRYNPTTRLSGGRFTGPDEPQYQSGRGQNPSAQFDGVYTRVPQQQVSGVRQNQQRQFVEGQGQGGFTPGRLEQFVGTQPSQRASPYIGGGNQQELSGLDREILQQQQLSGIPQQFSGSPQQFSREQGQHPYQQQQFLEEPQSPYFGTQQPYLAQQEQGQFSPQKLSGPSQISGPQSGSQQVGGIGRPDLQIQNQNNYDQSDFAGIAGTGFAGPNRFSPTAARPSGSGLERRPTSGRSSQNYIPNVELDGFSEDADQDGYVDPYPGDKNGATGGDVKTAQAAEKTAAVKTPDGERVNVTPGPYNPQVLGPQQSQQGGFPQGQIQGGRPYDVISPYDEQQLQQIYQQQGLGQGQIYPGGPQPNFQNQPEFQGQPLLGGQSPYDQGINGGQSPYQGQGIINGQSPYQGQGIISGQSPYQGQGIINGQSQFQGQGILAGQSPYQGQGIINGQSPYQGQSIISGQSPYQGQGINIPQSPQPQFQGQPEAQPQVNPEFQSQGGPQFQGQPGQQFQGQPGQQFQGQPQLSPQQQQQFSPEFQQGGGVPPQFLGGGQGGQFVGGQGGFSPFGVQNGPIPPQYFQGGRGQGQGQYVPQLQQQQSPYSGGIQSSGFPFGYSPYAELNQGGFQGNYPQGVAQQAAGQGQGQRRSASNTGSTKSDEDAREEKKV